MSSPRLNNIIVVGCLMTYFSVILFGLDGDLVSTEQYGKVCIVRNFICIQLIRDRLSEKCTKCMREDQKVVWREVESYCAC